MTLLARLFLRFAAIALVCMAAAAAFVGADALRSVRAEARAVAEIAARQIELDLLKSRSGYGGTGSFAAVDALPAGALGLGHCIRFRSDFESWTRCAGGEVAAGAVPAWFARGFGALPAGWSEVTRPVVWKGAAAGTLNVDTDPAAAVGRAYLRIATVAGVTAAVTLAMAALSFAAVMGALAPLRRISAGLAGLRAGDYGRRLPRGGPDEFDALGEAFNALAARLGEVTRERASLTRRLIRVEEEERRALARDLHDEFGQCLTAVQALAAGIAIDCGEGRTSEDARRIGELAARMADGVRGALARLRPPELDDYGFAESLRGLVIGRDSVLLRRDGSRIPVELTVDDGLEALPPEIALGLFRVAQECLTNVARHGSPARVQVRARREPGSGAGPVCRLEIEDDGGGVPADAGPGHGLTGIRERIAALGGLFDVERTATGLRVRASVPLVAGALP